MNKLIILCLQLAILGCSPHNTNKKSVGWRDFTGLENLRLKGTINYINNDIGNGYHGRGIIRIKILSKNIVYYDPSKYQENYYCKIKENEAEIYDNNLKDMDIGDTIQVDTSAQIISWSNKKNEKFEYSISIGEPAFFEFISKNKLQKL